MVQTDAVPDFLVMTVKATDKDFGENGRITYHLKIDDMITQETPEFSIDANTGELKTRKLLDREQRAQYDVSIDYQPCWSLAQFPFYRSCFIYSNFQLILAARDHGMPKWYETLCYLTILLVDMDDNRPEFPDSKTTNPYTFYISENDAPGVRIGQVRALDRDEGKHARVYYYLLSGSEQGAFTLDKSDGSLYTNRSFDREQRAEYDLYILANNDPDFYLTSEDRDNLTEEQVTHDGSIAKVKVYIRDVNDNAPTFERDVYYTAVNAMTKVNNFILNVTASDPDYGANGSISYYIKASNLYKYGSDKSSGSIIPSPFNITQQGQINTASYLAENNQHQCQSDRKT